MTRRGALTHDWRPLLSVLSPLLPSPSPVLGSSLLVKSAINTSEPANVVDYFYDGPWESGPKELLLLLIVQCGRGRCPGMEPGEPAYPWADVFFEDSIVLAILRTDERPTPAAIFMSLPYTESVRPAAAATRQFVTSGSARLTQCMIPPICMHAVH